MHRVTCWEEHEQRVNKSRNWENKVNRRWFNWKFVRYLSLFNVGPCMRSSCGRYCAAGDTLTFVNSTEDHSINGHLYSSHRWKESACIHSWTLKIKNKALCQLQLWSNYEHQQNLVMSLSAIVRQLVNMICIFFFFCTLHKQSTHTLVLCICVRTCCVSVDCAIGRNRYREHVITLYHQKHYRRFDRFEHF